jgi:hypothetical protein
LKSLSLLAVCSGNNLIAEEIVTWNDLEILTTSLSENIISFDFYADLLASWVTQRRFEEINEFLLKLPRDPPIHSLSPEQMQKVIYGRNMGRSGSPLWFTISMPPTVTIHPIVICSGNMKLSNIWIKDWRLPRFHSLPRSRIDI